MTMSVPLFRRGALSLLLIGSAVAFTAAAESLSDAWGKALRHDAGLAAVRLDTEAAVANMKAARAARLPQLEVGASYTRMADAPALSINTADFSFVSPRIFSNGDFVMRQAQVTLPIFAGGSLAAGVRAAEAGRSAAEADERRAQAELKLVVAQSYLGVLRAERALRAATASVEALNAHLADVAAMVEVGDRPNTDLLASRVASSAAAQQLARARLGLAVELGNYNRRLGEPLDRAVELEAVPPVVLEVATTDLPALQARAVRQRGELSGLQARADALRSAARAELGKMLPTVALTASYQEFENTVLDREDFRMVGVGFRWALFDGGQARHRATALRRGSESMRERRNELESLVQLEVQQSALAIEAADARVAMTRDAINEANENLRITRELYTEALVTNTAVLEAVALQTMAEAHAADAIYDAAIARLTLLKSLGEL